MTVDVDVRENCARFTKSRAASEEIFRGPKHASAPRAFDVDALSTDVDKRTIYSGMKLRSCDRNVTHDGRKYLEKSSRPQSRVREEDTGHIASRRRGVCFCNDCQNRRAEIDQYIPLTCEFETVEETCPELESTRSQNVNGDRSYDRELVGRESYRHEGGTCERQRMRNGEIVRSKERVRHGKRRRRYGRRGRNIEKCPVQVNSCEHTKHTFLPIGVRPDSFQHNCNVCANTVQPRITHRDSRETDQRLLELPNTSKRSNSSDSGTCTGSEAPTKWHPQDSVLSVHRAFKYRSDTDSGSKESAYAESIDECLKFCSCQHCYRHSSIPQHRLQRHSNIQPSRSSHSRCVGQDGRTIMADARYGTGNRLENYRIGSSEWTYDVDFNPLMPNRKNCNYIEAYTGDDGRFVYTATEGNFNKLPIDNTHLFHEESFQNGRHSNENLVYEDNVINMALPDTMPSYATVCECEACTYSRLNDSFIYGNGPLNAASPSNVASPWQLRDRDSDIERTSETNLTHLTVIK